MQGKQDGGYQSPFQRGKVLRTDNYLDALCLRRVPDYNPIEFLPLPHPQILQIAPHCVATGEFQGISCLRFTQRELNS